MLHILFLILKIIGIILAIVLGILLLLICIVLFVPINYQGSGKCDGTKASLCTILKVTWLFKIFQINIKYENEKIKYSIHIAWKKITGGNDHEKTEDISEQKSECEETTSKSIQDQKNQKVVEKSEEKFESIEKTVTEESVLSERVEEKAETIFQRNEQTEEVDKQTDQTIKKKISLLEKIKNKITDIKKKLSDICDKIKCTIKNICDKLNMLLEKKEIVMQFLQDKDHIKAFVKMKKELFKLLKRLKPKKFIIKGKFGFDDPSLTGKILAALSILYPFTEEHIEVCPDFENKVLEGRVMIKGRIYSIYFLCTVWNLFWCKQIRLLYKDVRTFKL